MRQIYDYMRGTQHVFKVRDMETGTCVCVCVCARARVHVHIQVDQVHNENMYVQIHTYIHIYTCVHKYIIHTYIRVCIHTYDTSIWAQRRNHTRLNTNKRQRGRCLCTHNAYIHTYIQVLQYSGKCFVLSTKYGEAGIKSMKHVSTCTCTYIHAYIHTYIHTGSPM